MNSFKYTFNDFIEDWENVWNYHRSMKMPDSVGKVLCIVFFGIVVIGIWFGVFWGN